MRWAPPSVLTGCSVDGGLTRSPYFLQFFTDIAGREIVDAGELELTALGAGLLGHAALGIDAMEAANSSSD